MDASQLQKSTIRVHRTLVAVSVLVGLGCTSVPEPDHTKFVFPAEGVFVKEPTQPYTTLGLVRAKVNFSTQATEQDQNEDFWCRNYYNKAAADLLKKAKKENADAVVEVRSVVFYADGRRELYPTPECSDDGKEGQILVQGIAAKWKVENPPEVVPSPSPKPEIEVIKLKPKAKPKSLKKGAPGSAH